MTAPTLKHHISLGAGVQSSTLALMAAHGEITPMPEFAVFADTGWEPKEVYDWLDWLETQLPFPVHRVSAGNIRADMVVAAQQSRFSIPYFAENNGAPTLLKRQCTTAYKIKPITKFLRRTALGLEPRQRAPKHPVLVQWRGISADEAQRMKPSRDPWLIARYPLAMELGYRRSDCLAWMQRHGYPEPPRSSCIGCPFRSNHEWRHLRDNSPAEWQDAIQFDRAIRIAGGARGKTYLHRSCKPLSDAPIDGDPDQGVLSFGDECEGMCGV